MQTEYILCEGDTVFLYIIDINMIFQKAVAWFRRIVTTLSLRRSRFNPGPVHVRFVVDELALGQVLLPVLRFPVSIIPPVLHTHLYLNLPQINAF
jgi:hypothetical protein